MKGFYWAGSIYIGTPHAFLMLRSIIIVAYLQHVFEIIGRGNPKSREEQLSVVCVEKLFCNDNVKENRVPRV